MITGLGPHADFRYRLYLDAYGEMAFEAQVRREELERELSSVEPNNADELERLRGALENVKASELHFLEHAEARLRCEVSAHCAGLEIACGLEPGAIDRTKYEDQVEPDNDTVASLRKQIVAHVRGIHAVRLDIADTCPRYNIDEERRYQGYFHEITGGRYA